MINKIEHKWKNYDKKLKIYIIGKLIFRPFTNKWKEVIRVGGEC